MERLEHLKGPVQQGTRYVCVERLEHLKDPNSPKTTLDSSENFPFGKKKTNLLIF